MRAIVIAVIAVVSFAAVRVIITSTREEDKSVFQFSKAEYVDHATNNCATDGNPESYCRCVYTELLEHYTVSEVLQMDVAVAADPNYKFSNKQLEIVAGCI